MARLRVFSAVFAALALMGAAPDTFTVDEVEALEAEKRAAEAQLAAIENARMATSDDLS